jgi:hypothetical protein
VTHLCVPKCKTFYVKKWPREQGMNNQTHEWERGTCETETWTLIDVMQERGKTGQRVWRHNLYRLKVTQCGELKSVLAGYRWSYWGTTTEIRQDQCLPFLQICVKKAFLYKPLPNSPLNFNGHIRKFPFITVIYTDRPSVEPPLCTADLEMNYELKFLLICKKWTTKYFA